MKLCKYLALATLFVSITIYPVIIGSDSAPSRQALVSLSGPTNTVMGFAALADGLVLTDTSTTFSFNSFFPINGSVSFNGGKCYQLEDMVFASNAEMVTSGTFIAQNNGLFFMPHSQELQLPMGGYFQQLSRTTVTWPYVMAASYQDNSLVAMGQFLGSPQYLSVFKVQGLVTTAAGSISGPAGTGFYSLDWWPTSSGNTRYIAAVWYINGTGGTGLASYSYNVVTTSMALVNSTLTGADPRACAFQPVSPYVIAVSDRTSKSVRIYSFTNGNFTSLLSTYTFSTYPADRTGLAWDYSGQYLAVSLGEGVRVLKYNGTLLSTTATVTTVGAANGASWSPDGNWLAIGFGAGSESVRVYAFDRNALTLTEHPSFRTGETASIWVIKWSPAGDFLAYYPGVYLQIRYVDYVRERLLVNYLANYDAGSWDMAWSANGTYLYYQSRNSTGYLIPYLLNATAPMYFSAASMVISSDVILGASLRLKGANLLDLQGHTLDLNGNSIVLESGATLMLSNATVMNMGQSNIQCIDNTCTLTLYNVHGWLNNNFNFNTGRLTIIGDVMLSGSYAFSYGSTQNLSIVNDSQLLFDSGMTFSYGSTSNSLITFQDRSSTLYLYETLVYTSNANGLTLLNGTLTVDGDCPVYSSGGLVFGNGTAANNLSLNILPDSGFTIRSGFIKNNNA